LPSKALGNRPILQIELARQETDLVEVLAPGRYPTLLAARHANTFDTFLFIPGYAGVLFCLGFLLALRNKTWRPILVWVVLLCVPMAAIFDWIENAGISATLDHFASGGAPHAGDAQRISTASLIKWGLLSFILLVYSAAIFSNLYRGGWGIAF